MMSRGDLTDAEWAALESLLPVSNNRCGRWRDHRQVINGIIHRLGAHAPQPPGGGGAPGEALGRSRGGLTTKVHLASDGQCRPLALLVTPGRRADCTQFIPVLDKIRVPRVGSGRPRRLPDSVSADRAYSNSKIRTYLRRRGISHAIPEKRDTIAARERRGSRGGRPPGFDTQRYAARNTVERAVNKLKQFRAVATRYDKRAYVYLGTVTAAAVLIWLRS